LIQKSFDEQKPTLYVVATPIGNLQDITYRAVETLKSVDLILCEDTRISGKLLKAYQIEKPLLSYHDHNKHLREQDILEHLKQGLSLALISDAGTPGISDPGYELIQAVIREGYPVVSIPGASALLAALVVSGLAIQPFVFLGFLPRKQSDKKTLLTSYSDRKETLVIYESPLRVETTLKDLHHFLGNRHVVLARELTKRFETIVRTTLDSVHEFTLDTRGEYVIIIDGALEPNYDHLSLSEHVKFFLAQGLDEKEAMKKVAKLRQVSKSDVYKNYKVLHKD